MRKNVDGLEMIAAALPSTPRVGMAEDVRRECREALGPEFCLYHRESGYPGMEQDEDSFIGWPGFDPMEPPHKWVAGCRCGHCGYEWYSGWMKGGKGVLMEKGEDETLYPGIPHDWCVEFKEYEELNCPWCETPVQLLHKRRLASGRVYRNMVGSIENAGRFTAVISWMAERYVSPDGDASFVIRPLGAAVIGEDGKSILYFTFRDGAWRPTGGTADPFQRFYHSYAGGMDRKAGGWLWQDVPEQLGQTGEKTGIADYFRRGGAWPILYLRFWQTHPAIENLVKAGWLHPFEMMLENEVLRFLQRTLEVPGMSGKKLHAPSDLECLADWTAVKPHEMLCMTRSESREAAGWKWDSDMLMFWVGCVTTRIAFPGDTWLLECCRARYGLGPLQQWADMASEGRTPATLEEIDRYCQKQARRYGLERRGMLTTYLDYWEMLDEDNATPEQIWPPNLQAAHDRIADSLNASNDRKYLPDFVRIRRKWTALEWSDGTICVRLPRCNQDLKDEGKVLHHCVGSYGKSHIAGRLVLFVRHARRPERSWFTLNIDTTKMKWQEIQLHGYGNEHAHGKQLRIPKEVRAFVDRWEKEVLTPVFEKIRRADFMDAEAAALMTDVEYAEQQRVRVPA